MDQLVSVAHVVGAVFAFINLVLSAVLSDEFLISPSHVNFIVFCSVWSLLVLAYVGLTPLYYQRIYNGLAALVLLAITTVFWFSGAIALAVALATPYCGPSSMCKTAQASIAFSFLLWAIFNVLAGLEGVAYWRGRRSPANGPTTPKP